MSYKIRYKNTYTIAGSGSQTIASSAWAGLVVGLNQGSIFTFSVTGSGTVDIYTKQDASTTFLKQVAGVVGGTGTIIMDLLDVTEVKITETAGNAVEVIFIVGD